MAARGHGHVLFLPYLEPLTAGFTPRRQGGPLVLGYLGSGNDWNIRSLRAFLDAFGFDYEFMSSTETYRSGRFDEVLLRLLERFDAVQAIMLPTLGEERRATWKRARGRARRRDGLRDAGR